VKPRRARCPLSTPRMPRGPPPRPGLRHNRPRRRRHLLPPHARCERCARPSARHPRRAAPSADRSPCACPSLRRARLPGRGLRPPVCLRHHRLHCAASTCLLHLASLCRTSLSLWMWDQLGLRGVRWAGIPPPSPKPSADNCGAPTGPWQTATKFSCCGPRCIRILVGLRRQNRWRARRCKHRLRRHRTCLLAERGASRTSRRSNFVAVCWECVTPR